MTREKSLAELQQRIGYTLKDQMLLVRALTHSSYGDGRRTMPDNERLEFLGDRVLGLLTAEYLTQKSNLNEGQMARTLNQLVRKETCADIARSINLGEKLLMSRAEEKQGGRDKTSIVGDACEALIAAIYLDGGLVAAKQFYNKLWQASIDQVLSGSTIDPKTKLQEKAAAEKLPSPIYTVLERKGPDHRPLFVVEMTIDGFGKSQAEGPSKKEAEKLAASEFLESWGTRIE